METVWTTCRTVIAATSSALSSPLSSCPGLRSGYSSSRAETLMRIARSPRGALIRSPTRGFAGWYCASKSSRVNVGHKNTMGSCHELERAIVTRPVSECVAQGACAGFDLPGKWHQIAGSDRVVRSIRGVAEEYRDANGVQACDIHRRACASGELVFGARVRRLSGPRVCRCRFLSSSVAATINRRGGIGRAVPYLKIPDA